MHCAQPKYLEGIKRVNDTNLPPNKITDVWIMFSNDYFAYKTDGTGKTQQHTK